MKASSNAASRRRNSLRADLSQLARVRQRPPTMHGDRETAKQGQSTAHGQGRATVTGGGVGRAKTLVNHHAGARDRCALPVQHVLAATFRSCHRWRDVGAASAITTIGSSPVLRASRARRGTAPAHPRCQPPIDTAADSRNRTCFDDRPSSARRNVSRGRPRRTADSETMAIGADRSAPRAGISRKTGASGSGSVAVMTTLDLPDVTGAALDAVGRAGPVQTAPRCRCLHIPRTTGESTISLDPGACIHRRIEA